MFLVILIITMKILQRGIKMLTILYIKNHHFKKQFSMAKDIQLLCDRNIRLMEY